MLKPQPPEMAVQAYLGDIVCLVPDYQNRVNIAQISWFSSTYKSYVYTVLYSIKYKIAYVFKKQCT